MNEKRNALIKKHIELVKNGDYVTASLILRFLLKRSIAFSCNPESASAEVIIEDAGFKPHYNRYYTVARFYF